MSIHLIGQKDTKRYDYFCKACAKLETKFEFWDINSNLVYFLDQLKSGDIIKIDPPKYKTSSLQELNGLVYSFNKQLQKLEHMQGIQFLNKPSAIWKTLDKKQCKKILLKNHIDTTPMLDKTFTNFYELKEYMLTNAIHSVFIKPRFGSGAAGVIAYRIHPNSKTQILQTCIKNIGERFENTKQIFKINDESQIQKLINFILEQDCIVEKWIPKPKIGDSIYDIRVVFQFGQIDHILARGSSSSAITNLHLNNKAIAIETLALSKDILVDIHQLCSKGVACFDGLNSAGIDILLSGKKQKPMIIEINGQGDLIYNDIFNENKIYTNQVVRMIKSDKNK
ncbi:hypothetical protein SAMN05446037_10624 [Anaerovirgula multivorans]|uniref:ATP-grasp domain-containing protein n=1 Tax=Anaerovirgula multivorans TaxID=312168 RepID=A0A239L3L7_9FIRM|nr:STM4014 family protein [Anaerovirgula multivorans]SNT24935.1 hypothetical protein SAMN05446037_10624 [Anaerovirgula multivorans]